MLDELLTAEGHNTLLARDRESTLASLDSEIPDLIFIDIRLAAEENFELLKRLKSSPGLSCITVVIIADNIELDSVVACVQSGAVDYLLRPFNTTRLNARIEATLKSKADPLLSKSIGNYTVKRKIGSGGMADVYLAHHSMLRRSAALKILRKDATEDMPEERFEHEVQLCSALTHPNTISVYDYGRTEDGLYYYAMEYLDGIDLNTLVKLESSIPESRIIHILRQVCASLGEAHHHGIMHRDIKPENIFLCERGGDFDFVKVLDFGIAKTFNEREDTHSTLASPLFISPEAAATNLLSDRRGDLYSVGAVGYYLLTRQFVFDHSSQIEIMKAHVNEDAVPPSQRTDRKVSPDLEALIMYCLEKRKENRPKSAKALFEMLGRCEQAGKWASDDATKWWTNYLQSKWPSHVDSEDSDSRLESDITLSPDDQKRRLRLQIIASRLTPPEE